MLSLLSRIVTGGDCEECRALEREDPGGDDTDEERLDPPMPVISIDQAEVAEDALRLSRRRKGKEEEKPTITRPESSEDTGEDSPFERDAEAPAAIPGRDVLRRISELVEYYLSDENLVRDMFILKHVTKHREGYVSLKLLASYKKVKRITKDWRVVARSLEESKELELNEERTKVRRKKALPQEVEEDTRPFRTLLATDIAREKANMNGLAEFFAKFGEMTSLQMHKPGGRCLEEVRQGESKSPGISGTVCAVVEYEKVHHARQAIRFIANNSECSGMKVVELPRRRNGGDSLLSIKAQAEGESAYYSTSDVSEPASPVCRTRPHYRLKSLHSSKASSPSLSPVVRRRTHEPRQSSPESSSPPSPYFSRRGSCTPPSSSSSSPPEDHHSPPPSSRGIPPPGSSPLPRRQPSPRPRASDFSAIRRCISNSKQKASERFPVAAPLSPWMRRRLGSSASLASPSASPSASPNLRRRQEASSSSPFVPPNVVRHPRGPDGTRGFCRKPMVDAQA